MKKLILLVFLLSLYGCSVLYAQHKEENKPNHYLIAMYGKNQLYYDCIRSHKTISVGYNPLPFTQGFGLNAWYLQHDASYYGRKPSIIIIQPSVNLLYKSLALKLGMNINYMNEEGYKWTLSLMPVIEIKYGLMKNLYFSFYFKSDMFFGSINANIHYLFNDNISGIMLGYTYKENWDDDYNGLAYKLDYMIFEKILLRVCGNIDLKFKSKGIQAGIGILI